MVTVPPSIDAAMPLSESRGVRIDQATLGSCAGNRLDDLRDAASILCGRRASVGADVILTHCAEVKVTHLGEDDGLLAAVDVDPGASSGDTSDGPQGRGSQRDSEAAGLLAQHGEAIPA